MNGPLVLTRTIDVHERLLRAGIGNAIGGALALAYYSDDPRATQDIDLNISLPADRAADALRSLPGGVPWDDTTLARIRHDDQVRLMWPVPGQVPMPLDLFFAVGSFHDNLARRTAEVPMLDTSVRIVSATDLTVLKALFDRPKDWVDIDAMLAAHDSAVDVPDAVGWLASIIGDDDPRCARLASRHSP